MRRHRPARVVRAVHTRERAWSDSCLRPSSHRAATPPSTRRSGRSARVISPRSGEGAGGAVIGAEVVRTAWPVTAAGPAAHGRHRPHVSGSTAVSPLRARGCRRTKVRKPDTVGRDPWVWGISAAAGGYPPHVVNDNDTFRTAQARRPGGTADTPTQVPPPVGSTSSSAAGGRARSTTLHCSRPAWRSSRSCRSSRRWRPR